MTERFELLEQLGQGGMGTVWKARDSETGEVVALKLLHSLYVNDPDYVARFEREVEIARRIHSPHVVQVLGYGKRDGVPYVAMEYVEGQSLKELLKERGRLEWPEARGLFSQLLEGLAAAHAAGVLHRDVKPGNLLIDRAGQLKVADFGISRAADLTRMTGSATVLGTPTYMAPEGQVDERSEIYSAGCVLYEMLGGRPPFEGDSMHSTILKHLREEPDLSRIPTEARGLVERLLAKEPERRPASVAVVLLDTVQAGSVGPGASRQRLQIGTEISTDSIGVLCRAWWVLTGHTPETTLRVPITVKMMHEHLAEDPDLLDAFAGQVEVSNRVQSIYVLRAHEFLVADGRPTLMMDYFAGESLSRLLAKRRQLGWELAGPIARQIAEALAATHAAKLVHGCLTPANILVGPDLAAKLTGFEGAVLLVRGRGLFGLKASYPATEPSQSADVFAWGATVFQMVRGEWPYFERGWERWLDDVPVAFRAIIGQTMAQRPADRPSARDLAHLLREQGVRRERT